MKTHADKIFKNTNVCYTCAKQRTGTLVSHTSDIRAVPIRHTS